jgi:hypothetical protein
MLPDQIVQESIKYAESETERFGLPTKLHLDISLQKGREIANALGADQSIVVVGVCMMDIKLGEAFKLNRQPEHVKMSVNAAREFLSKFNIDQESIRKILNSVEAHHGAVPFDSIEAEIVANADCYRFIHPLGVFHYIGTLTKRNLSIEQVIAGAESKLNEKRQILSLDYCKAELEPFYESFKQLFSAGKKEAQNIIAAQSTTLGIK